MRHIVTVPAVAAVMVAMTIMTVVPAIAQGGKAKAKGKAAAAPTAAPNAAPKAMANTGGLISPSNVLVGLGGGALLVGGGLVALRAVKR